MKEKFIHTLFADHQKANELPSPVQVYDWLDGILGVLFPEFANHRFFSEREFAQHFQQLELALFKILNALGGKVKAQSADIEKQYVEMLPGIREWLWLDAQAILAGDPAAPGITEVIRTYPGFYAIAVYRLAHAFYQLEVPLIPRILTEYAHGKTGVDIHPAARIGQHFCIDHGTGVVIGETCEIGDRVKIYQGVTLGALSVRKELAQTKRHPTIEDEVVVYSGATILGGSTVIGKGSIIGGNVWLTESVPANSRIYYSNAAGTTK